MAIVLVHYHLRRGGVSRVIRIQSKLLRDAGVPHVILSGSADHLEADLPVRVVQGLCYDSEHQSLTPLRLVQALRNAAQDALGMGNHVWHFHNHSIGKNGLIAEAVSILSEAGEPMILQIHDFAEDGRPQNYPRLGTCDHLYPYAPQIRYAFLNSRDRSYLVQAGLPEWCATLLPNPITAPVSLSQPPLATDTPLVLYPVRGIRRKNLGELFLLAALAPEGTRFAVSLGPDSPQWAPYYQAWDAFARDTHLPVLLEVVGKQAPVEGADSTFEDWVHHATHLITTSVAEGFGLGFLEPITLGKPLLGRNLPMVTKDFAREGIQPGSLYDHILVPESWVGIETLRQRLVRELCDTVETYGHDMSGAQLDASFGAMRHRGMLDFGNLPEDLQRQVIHRILAGSGRHEIKVEINGVLHDATEWLSETLAARTMTATQEQLLPYSLEVYYSKLKGLYDEVQSTTPSAPAYLPKHKVLAQFLQPGSFHFLRT